MPMVSYDTQSRHILIETVSAHRDVRHAEHLYNSLFCVKYRHLAFTLFSPYLHSFRAFFRHFLPKTCQNRTIAFKAFSVSDFPSRPPPVIVFTPRCSPRRTFVRLSIWNSSGFSLFLPIFRHFSIKTGPFQPITHQNGQFNCARNSLW